MLPCSLFLPKHISTSLVFLRSARHGFALLPRWVPRLSSDYPPAAPIRLLAAAASSRRPADGAGAPSRVMVTGTRQRATTEAGSGMC